MLSPVKDRSCPECGQSIPEGEDCVVCLMRTISKEVVHEARSAPCRLGEYELINPLGQGGMGTVYRAHHLTLQRDAAVKMVTAPLGHERESRRRFLVETRTLSSLEHPGILPLYESGEESGTLWFAMKFAKHGSLRDWIDSLRGKWEDIARIVAAIAEAVHYAHQRGVIHRDLKPSNILFDEPGKPCVADFGIARLVEEGGVGSTMSIDKILGTPAYMSPELLTGDVPTATMASDIYGVGVILYELLTGRLPRTGRSLPAQISEAQAGPPPSPARLDRSVPPDLSTITEKAISLNPSKRYATAGDFAADLENWLHHRPIQARPVTPLERVKLWARRRPLPAALLGLMVLLAIAFSIFLGNAWAGTRAAVKTAAKARDLAETNVDYMVMQMPKQLGSLGRSDLVEASFKNIARYYAEAELLSPDATMDARHAFFLLQWADVSAARGRKDDCMQKVSEAVAIAERAVGRETPPDLAWYVAFRAHLTAAGYNSHYSEHSARDDHRKRAAWMVEQGLHYHPGSPVMQLARCLSERDRIQGTDMPGSPDAVVSEAKKLIAQWEPLLAPNVFAGQPLIESAAVEGYGELLNFAGWKAADNEAAIGFLQKAVAFREGIAQASPEDWQAQAARSDAYEQLGVKYSNIDGGDPKRSRELLVKSREIAREVAARDGQNLHAAANLGTSTANEAYTAAEDASREKDPEKARQLRARAISIYADARVLFQKIQAKDESLNARATLFEGVIDYRVAELMRQGESRDREGGPLAVFWMTQLFDHFDAVGEAQGLYEKSIQRRLKYLDYESGSWNEHDSFILQVKLCAGALRKLDLPGAASSLLQSCLQQAKSFQDKMAAGSPAYDNWRHTNSVLHAEIADDMFAQNDENGALQHTVSAQEIQLKLLESPGMAPLIVKTLPDPLTNYFKKTTRSNEPEALLLVQGLQKALPGVMALDPKAFPRSEWAAAFAAARQRLDAFAPLAAETANRIFPSGIPLSSSEAVLKQRLLGE